MTAQLGRFALAACHREGSVLNLPRPRKEPTARFKKSKLQNSQHHGENMLNVSVCTQSEVEE